MRTLVHLSDLHFGDEDPATIEPLVSLVHSLAPDVLVVSGDLTQRARRRQFESARAFLDALPRPRVVVPGNHDVPLFDVVRRFTAPYARWKRLISDELEPSFLDDEIVVLGLNSARSFTWKSGRLSRAQLESAAERLAPLDDTLVKIVVTHHPFDVPPNVDPGNLLQGARRAMEIFARVGADLFLSGHVHVSHAGETARRYRLEGHSALVVNAGTATSRRQRGEVNTFNVLRLASHELTLTRYAWTPEARRFAPRAEERFVQLESGWQPAKAAAPAAAARRR